MKIACSLSLAFKTFPLPALIIQRNTLLHLHNYSMNKHNSSLSYIHVSKSGVLDSIHFHDWKVGCWYQISGQNLICTVTTSPFTPTGPPRKKNDPTPQSKRNFYRDTSPEDCKRSSTSRAVLLISSSAFGINELCIGAFIPTVLQSTYLPLTDPLHK